MNKQLKSKIAKGFIKLMFGVDEASVSHDGNLTFTKHKSTADGPEWEVKFKISESGVRWGLKEGRWRDREEDIKLSCTISDKNITVQEDIGGVVNTYTFEG